MTSLVTIVANAQSPPFLFKLLPIFLLGFVATVGVVEGCSPSLDKNLGFFPQGVATPINFKGNNGDLVLVTLDYFTLESESNWNPDMSVEVVVNMETGEFDKKKPDEANRLEVKEPPKPTLAVQSSNDFSLKVDLGSTPPTATIISRDNSGGTKDEVFWNLTELPDGSIRDDDTLQNWELQRLQYENLLFYSPSLNLVYVLYTLGSKALVKTFSVVVENNSTTVHLVEENFFEAIGLQYIAPAQGSLGYKIYDDTVQVLELPGAGSDCVYTLYAYYNQTSLAQIASSTLGNTLDLQNSIDTTQGTFYDSTTQKNWVYTPLDSSHCPKNVESCQSVRISNFTIIEFAIRNNTNARSSSSTGWGEEEGPDPTTILRRVTLYPKDIEEIYGLNSSSSGTSSRIRHHPALLLVAAALCTTTALVVVDFLGI